MANWEYGKNLLEEEDIDEEIYANWSDQKESVLSYMDRWEDYLWNINEDGSVVFIDRLYASEIFEPWVEERIKNGTHILKFASLDEAEKYVEEKKIGAHTKYVGDK